MKEELYEFDYEEALEPLTIPFRTMPRFKVTGPRVLYWGARRQIDRLNDGGVTGLIDAIVHVWLAHPDTTWTVRVKDPNTGAKVELPRTADVIDGLVRPCLKPEDVVHIGLEAAKVLYPTAFPWELLTVSAEGELRGVPESTPRQNGTDSTEPSNGGENE